MKQIQLVKGILLVILAALVGVFGSAAVGMAAELTGSETTYVASTAWTAAIAEAAGAQNVEILAPLELRHPPEYDFRPSDVTKVLEADLIFWGGYEGFVRKLVAANNIPEERLYRVMTNNNPDILKEQTRAIARKIGTEDAQKAWEEEFDKLLARLREAAHRKNVQNTRVLVNFHQEKFIRWLGYNVVGVIGPDDLTPAKIGELLAAKPDMVIDNWHNAQARPVAEAAGVPYVELLNFPGTHGTRSIQSVIEYNASVLGLIE